MVNLSILISSSEVSGPGGLFDFNATLPLVAIQFVLLTLILNTIFYSPLLTVIEERKEYILGNLSKASEISGYNEYKIKHNNDMKIKPTTNGIVELSEQLKPSNPRKMELTDNKNNTDTSDIDMINFISQQTKNIEPLMSELHETNLYTH